MNEIPKQEPEKLHLTPEELEKLKKRVERAEKLADVLDKKMLDPIIGLVVPEGGDALTGLAGLYIIYEAKQLDMPAWELAKMLGRTKLDWLIGSVPIVGDFFDFFNKSNVKNAEVLREHFEKIKADAGIELEEGDLIVKDRQELREDIEGMKKAA
ncbi:DUF4112 domain-containing protein [Candidatus Pacearchaeota archaeon]|nr:DUF4112 domain-containing protein [Candidatus Pacearchaeota archaeon]